MCTILHKVVTVTIGIILNLLIHSMVISAVIITAPVLLLILVFSREAFLHTLRFDRVRCATSVSAYSV
jgi:Mn2+/Fe2+ NRAMP family transporter